MTKIDLTPCTSPTVDALVALHPGGEPDGGPLAEYDAALEGQLPSLLSAERFTGKLFQQLRIHTLGKLPFPRLLLLGTGAEEELTAAQWISLGERIGEAASKSRWASVAVVGLDGDLSPEVLPLLIQGVLQGGYRFDRYQTVDADNSGPVDLDRILLVHQGDPPSPTGLERAALLAEAVCFARDLVNEPAEVATPDALAKAAREIAQKTGLACEVLDAEQCADLGMALFLAVGRGSRCKPRFIHLTHTPTEAPADGPKIALVGKGITFDSGGLSLKPSASMKDMKCDMAGGAAVLAAMRLMKAWDVSVEVHGIVPACENMPSGHAYRLGDVIRGMDGPSVEVVNTDAEGRLILADAISYARSIGCTQIIDLATLTGACVVGLGPDIAGVMGPDDDLVTAFLDAAERAGEATWRLPLPAALAEQLKSPVADCKNAGGRYGGALTAALFLKKFAQNTPWLHVDVAGPAYADKAKAGRPAGGTGFGVATLLAFLTRDAEGGMSWLWRVLFFGRIRRLKRIQKAAAMVAAGRIEEADHILSTSKPKVWVDDLAVYHFVRGKLLMEQGDLDQAEIHLHAAIALGLDRASVKLNQAVLLVRKCQLNAALALLGDVDLSDDPAVLEQSRVMREVIEEARRGVGLTELGKRAARFRKKHLKKVDPAAEKTLPALALALREAKLSGSDRDDACLLLGQVMAESGGGTWLLGLEPRDHQVLVTGLIYSPARMIDALLDGDIEQLALPPAPPSA